MSSKRGKFDFLTEERQQREGGDAALPVERESEVAEAKRTICPGREPTSQCRAQVKRTAPAHRPAAGVQSLVGRDRDAAVSVDRGGYGGVSFEKARIGTIAHNLGIAQSRIAQS